MDIHNIPEYGENINEWTCKMIRHHFSPETGSPFWIEKAKQLNFDPVEDIHCFNDLEKFGILNDSDLKNRSMQDFITKAIRKSRN